MEQDETITGTCIPTTEAVETVRHHLQQDNTLQDRTNLNTAQVCHILDLCLNTVFQFYSKFYRQKYGSAVGSPVSPFVANLFTEMVECKALNSYKRNASKPLVEVYGWHMGEDQNPRLSLNTSSSLKQMLSISTFWIVTYTLMRTEASTLGYTGNSLSLSNI